MHYCLFKSFPSFKVSATAGIYSRLSAGKISFLVFFFFKMLAVTFLNREQKDVKAPKCYLFSFPSRSKRLQFQTPNRRDQFSANSSLCCISVISSFIVQLLITVITQLCPQTVIHADFICSP